MENFFIFNRLQFEDKWLSNQEKKKYFEFNRLSLFKHISCMYM